MKLRAYRSADLPAIVELFTASVHEMGAAHYDRRQRDVWAPAAPDLDAWATRLSGAMTLVVEDSGELAGFIACERNGHIDLLYTAPRFARRGVASRLLRQVQDTLAGTALFTEASLVARPFFLGHGFIVVEEQRVVRGGVEFRRFAMRKA